MCLGHKNIDAIDASVALVACRQVCMRLICSHEKGRYAILTHLDRISSSISIG